MPTNLQKNKSKLKLIPQYLAKRSIASHNYKYIPRKIFQTFYTNQVPKHLNDVVQTWIKKNPTWDYHFFDNEDCRQFIEQNFDYRVLRAYDELVPGAFKADLWRYCILYVHGGVYADIKQKLLTPLDEIIPHEVEFLSVKDRDMPSHTFHGYIYQAFICSKKGHPFLKKAIQAICDNTEKKLYHSNHLEITGPGLLGKVIKSCIGESTDKKIKVGLNRSINFDFFLWSCPNKNKEVFTHKNIKALEIEYSAYRSYYKKYCLKGKKTYGQLWRQGKSYLNIEKDKIRTESPLWIKNQISFKIVNKKRREKKLLIQGSVQACKAHFAFKGRLGLKIKINGLTVKIYRDMKIGSFKIPIAVAQSSDSIIQLVLIGVKFTNFLAGLSRLTCFVPMPKFLRNFLLCFEGHHKNRRLIIENIIGSKFHL